MTMLRRLGVACAAACAIALCGAPAVQVLAQVVTTPAATASSTQLDLTQLAIASLPLIGGALTIMLPVVLNRLATATHSQTLAAMASDFMPMAQLALAQAQGKAKDWIAANGVTVEVQSHLVKEAGEWLAQHAQAEIEAKRYTPEMVANHLEAMIHLNTTPPEHSVAIPTPPATVPASPASPVSA